MEEIKISRASIDDAYEILKLQKRAYVSEAEIINDFTIPPLHQTFEEILSEFNNQIFMKALYGNRIVGSVRCYSDKGTCYIGKLIVEPELQNNGLGTMLLETAEKQFPDVKRYELFTGNMSEKNLFIYAKKGYRIFDSKIVSDKLTLLFLEKKM